MKIDFTKFIYSLSVALDYAEEELIKSTRNHGKRVAVMSNLMAAKAGFDDESIFALTQAALLHDCALAEYLNDELDGEKPVLNEKNMFGHCMVGETMLLKLPVYSRVPGSVLYHHERGDGKGAFGKLPEETPLSAQIIHIADIADVTFAFGTMDRKKYEELVKWIDAENGRTLSAESVELFKSAIDYEFLAKISGEGCRSVLHTMLPVFSDEVSVDVLREMASFFAKITDYKSHFTWRHSTGIAEKAEKMGYFYGYEREICDKLYISGALHDIGKLLISNDILEKPGKLTNAEYKEIQNHAMGTWELLSGISGLEDISRWAALHHEKLDGSGYPFGYKAEDLDKNERLLACLDIYQALVEERPYKAGMSHKDAMSILNKMGKEGQLDQDILNDIDDCFSVGSIETSAPREKAVMLYSGETWRCPVCGYAYEGPLPDDFICPRCEQPAAVFERVN